ncbi:titin-like isoform X19 [Anthonomus grandis grandis]|uniref:titin-like isoform X19 n=1 Tax=Anthonomus grandis grandis TaxID=2921223 RepID=UPI0021668F74|nr:titin-like isoform X19 [Anthonomus grandis grandis]
MESGVAAQNGPDQGPESPKSKLLGLLPDQYTQIIIKASENEDFEGLYGKIRLSIATKEEALLWIRRFELKNLCSYRGQKSWSYDPELKVYQKKFVCAHRTTPEDPEGGSQPHCDSTIVFTLCSDPRTYPSQATVRLLRHHRTSPPPAGELRVTFCEYYVRGHSPFSALVCHKCDIHSKFGPTFYDAVPKGTVCPSYNWCSSEYKRLFSRHFRTSSFDGDEISRTIEGYNKQFVSPCADIHEGSLVVCTPLMKSVFHSGFGEDLITLKTLCSSKGQKVVLFLCHTPIGSFPFGIIITSSTNISGGIRCLLGMLNASNYKPATIILDENMAISACLKETFPDSQLIFNEFQMLQSIWRVIRLVCQGDNEEFQALYEIFFQTLNSVCEEDFSRNLDSLMVYAEKHPKLASFLNYFKQRSSAYVLYAKPKVDFNTDVLNYTDSGTMLLQDVTVKYSEHFNLTQLFDFVTNNYMDHYERKLRKIIQGDLRGYFKTNFYVPLTRLIDFTVQKITDTEFLVCLNDFKYFVNAELDTCTCQVGLQGGSCVHQYIVEKTLGLLPECYTPIEEYMTNIFKSILAHKESLRVLRQEQPQQEPLGKLPELPGGSEEFEEPLCEDQELLNDQEHFNRESGELEWQEVIEAPPSEGRERVFTPVEEFMEPLCLSGEDDSLENNKKETENIDKLAPQDINQSFINEAPLEEIFTEHPVRLEILPSEETDMPQGLFRNEAAVVEEIVTNNMIQDGTVDSQTEDVVVLQDCLVDSSILYSYITDDGEDRGETGFQTADPVLPPEPQQEILEELQPNAQFSEYKVMEDGLLTEITVQTDNVLTTDSFDDSNMIMVSPTEVLLEEEEEEEAPRTEPKINVLSSLVIKPPKKTSLDLDSDVTEDAYEIEISQGDPENLIKLNSPKKPQVFKQVSPKKLPSPFKISQSQEDFTKMVKELRSQKNPKVVPQKRPLKLNLAKIQQPSPAKVSKPKKPKKLTVKAQVHAEALLPSPIKINKVAPKRAEAKSKPREEVTIQSVSKGKGPMVKPLSLKEFLSQNPQQAVPPPPKEKPSEPPQILAKLLNRANHYKLCSLQCKEVHSELEDLSDDSDLDEYDFEEDILSDCDSIVEQEIYDDEEDLGRSISPPQSVQGREDGIKKPDLKDDELSFLLNDPRFEMEVETEERAENQIEYVTEEEHEGAELNGLLKDLGFNDASSRNLIQEVKIVIPKTPKEGCESKKRLAGKKTAATKIRGLKSHSLLQRLKKKRFARSDPAGLRALGVQRKNSAKTGSVGLEALGIERNKSAKIDSVGFGALGGERKNSAKPDFVGLGALGVQRKKSAKTDSVGLGALGVERKNSANPDFVGVKALDVEKKTSDKNRPISLRTAKKRTTPSKASLLGSDNNKLTNKDPEAPGSTQGVNKEPVQEPPKKKARNSKLPKKIAPAGAINGSACAPYTIYAIVQNAPQGPVLCPLVLDPKNTSVLTYKPLVVGSSSADKEPPPGNQKPEQEPKMQAVKEEKAERVTRSGVKPVLEYRKRKGRFRGRKTEAEVKKNLFESGKKKSSESPVDFESSITASVVERADPAGASSVKYEDAFKRFLEAEAYAPPPAPDTRCPAKKPRKRRRPRSILLRKRVSKNKNKRADAREAVPSNVVSPPKRKRGRPLKSLVDHPKSLVDPPKSLVDPPKSEKFELIILLERDEEIEQRCVEYSRHVTRRRSLGRRWTTGASPGTRGGRKGYLELLEVARQKKSF